MYDSSIMIAEELAVHRIKKTTRERSILHNREALKLKNTSTNHY